MTENPGLGKMDSDTLSSFREAFRAEEKGTQKVSDSFTVDMERFSHLTSKDVIPNSRITLQRNLSRKEGSQRGGGREKKMNSSSADNERDASGNLVQSASSPRAALEGASKPEKPIVVIVGATNHAINEQIHHQIAITAAAATATTKSKLGGKRYSFQRSSRSWTIDPRRILFFFATLSIIGTVLLIYFTLSMGRLSGGDDNILN